MWKVVEGINDNLKFSHIPLLRIKALIFLSFLEILNCFIKSLKKISKGICF